jgi:hypothetical protein
MRLSTLICPPRLLLLMHISNDESNTIRAIGTYGIQLWGTTSNSNIEILERFQSKVLRLIVDAPWYVSNSFIRKDLQIPTVKFIFLSLCIATVEWMHIQTHRLMGGIF